MPNGLDRMALSSHQSELPNSIEWRGEAGMGVPGRRQRGLTLVEYLGLLTAWVVLSFRLLSLPLLVAAVICARRLGCGSPWVWVLLGVFFVSMFSPIDIAVMGIYKGGAVHPSGLRLVRCTRAGMTAHSEMRAKYGEYYHNCLGGLFPTHWVLVLY